MSATVDKAALQMLLAGHEIVHMTWSVGRAGWSVTAECHCGQVRPLARRGDHLTDVIIDGIEVWLLPDNEPAGSPL